jgi:pyridoxal phosphate enzyme (YggS family)
MSTIAENIARINENITLSADKSGRKREDINLVCVTKYISLENILEAVSFNINIIGESRVEEAQEKKDSLPKNVSIHMIGHLQSRKAKDAVRVFSLIHSVDTMSLALEINKRAENIGKAQNILLEVNISGETTKYGITPDKTICILKEISTLQNIKVSGLMTMAPLADDPELTRPVFRGMKELFEKVKAENISNIEMKYLSMGMSQDYMVAIEEGSNMVRIGTAIFEGVQ